MIIAPWKSPKKNSVIYPELSFSTMLGIMSKEDFICNNRLYDEYLLLYVTKGNLFCEQYDTSLVIKKDSYLLLDKHYNHRYYFDPNIPSEIYWMHIGGAQTRDMIERISLMKPLPCVGSNPHILEAIQTSMDYHNGLRGDVFSDAANIISALYEILRDAYNEQIHKKSLPEEIAFCADFEKILCESDISALSLDSICVKMHMNKYYFSHKFKEYYRISPMKYINMLKLDKAKYLLRCTDMKIKSIAQICGFSSNTYFANAFRREFNMSPEKYRAYYNKV